VSDILRENRVTVFYIAIAFAFSIAMRLIWVYQFQGFEAFHLNGQFMINTNDGYYWAEGARDILSGSSTNPQASGFFDKFHQVNDLSPVSSAVSLLTALLVKVLPFSFESIIFYMPAFLGSLIVVPIILIAKELKNLEMGLVAALLASIAWSYYNRTMSGYYDSDMLTVVLPMFVLWGLIVAIDTNKQKYLLFTALSMLAYKWWYEQSYSLEVSFVGLVFLYTIFFDRKNLFNYKLLIVMLLAMMKFSDIFSLIAIFAFYIVFKDEKYNKYIFPILGITTLLFLFFGGLTPIWTQVKGYIIRESISNSSNSTTLHFYTVLQTVREAGHIPFEVFANRISGNIWVFFISIAGYLYLLYKHKIMLFSIPLVGLGFLAYVGGLRFTVYAVPVLALGIGFLIVESTRLIKEKKIKYTLEGILVIAILYPNYKHIEHYHVPTVFTKTEVKALEKLKEIASREDYVVTWWDYGYPIRYYSDVKTLIDGGKHTGNFNFPVSYILTRPQVESYNMAVLDVYQTEQNYKENLGSDYLKTMLKEYNVSSVESFLSSLSNRDFKLPKVKENIYLYLPNRMLDIFPTVALFSDVDLKTGKLNKRPFFYQAKGPKETKQTIELGNNIRLLKKNMRLQIGSNIAPIHRFTVVMYDKDRILHKSEKVIYPTSRLNVIYMPNFNRILVLDDSLYNSTYIQLYVLENYDKNLFEPVILTPLVKVFKVKK